MKRLIMGMSLAALLVGGMTTQSLAVTMGFCDGLNNIGFCEKSVTLSGNQLTIVLKNTTPVASGGFITADAFDLAGNVSINSFSTTDAAFSLVSFSAGSINVSPFGNREFAISNQAGATQPWLGSGQPTNGIAPDETVTWTLGLTGDLSILTEESFFASELVRFRGLDVGEGSDKATTPIGPGPGPGPGPGGLPVPSTFLLIGVGLMSLGLAHLKKGPKN